MLQICTLMVTKCGLALICSRDVKSVIPANVSVKPHLIVANHLRGFDSCVIFAALPLKTALQLLPAGFMLASRFYHSPIKPLVWMGGCFPAQNTTGKDHLFGVSGASKLISKGFSIQMFPEGRRIKNGNRKPAYPGIIALIEDNPHTPLILCHIEYNYSFSALIKRRWATIHFALEKQVDYTDSNKLMDKIYQLPHKEKS